MTDDRELQAFAADLRRHRTLAAPARLRADVRASLYAAPFDLPLRPARRSFVALLRPIVAAVVVLALLAGAGGTAAAASLPGDAAYPLKRAAEDAQVALTFDDASRLDLLVALTDRRLVELETVEAVRPANVGVALDAYLALAARLDAQVAATLAEPETAARDAALARASVASAAHVASLRSLAGRLPAAAQPGITHAIDAQEAVHGKAGTTPAERGTTPGRGASPSARPTPRR